MLTEADIVDALRTCFDAALGADVVSLGMVGSVRLVVDVEAPGAGIAGVPLRQRLWLSLLSGKDDGDRRAMLGAQILNRLAGIEGLSRVELAWQDGWRELLPILNRRG